VRSAEGDKLGAMTTTALAQGMDPDEVGRLVLDGIRHDRFWIFTEPRLNKLVQQQVDTMVENGSLTRLRLM
jgi:hypothetical protein